MRLETFDDAGNLVFVAAYLVKDVLWLRILSIVGALIILPYYLLQPEPLWTPVIWAHVFIGIHIFRAWQIYRERRPAKLTPEEETLYNQAFSSLSSQQFGRLSAAGIWRDLDEGEMLQAIGDPVTRVTALASGKMDVSRNGKSLGSFGPGDLLGITCLYEDSTDKFRELLDTRVAEPSRILEWDANELKRLTQADPEFDHVFHKLVASSLATKLIRFVQLE